MTTIKNNNNGEVVSFNTLDQALRTLHGNDGQPLLKGIGRLTQAQAEVRLAKNGYELMPKKDESASAVRDLATILGELVKVEDKVTAAVSEQMAEMESRLQEIANSMTPKTTEIVVSRPDGVKVNVGTQHEEFETLLNCVSARVNVLMVGPAGSGKTMAAEKVAESLGLKYYTMSVGAQTTKFEFFGYTDANGNVVRTLFREAFEHGGVFLIDEMDAGNANVIVSINQALANGCTAFPDGMVKKHADFVLIASANTWGAGANKEYVGRNQLDASTIDRFAMIEWNYDLKLEEALTPNKEWLAEVRRVREIVQKNKIRQIISPRASITGSKLIAAGLKWEKVVEMVLLKGMNQTEKALCV